MKHRIAILSDIHGNTTALEAVIKDAQELGALEEIGMIAFWRLWMGSMVWRTLKKFSSCDLPST